MPKTKTATLEEGSRKQYLAEQLNTSNAISVQNVELPIAEIDISDGAVMIANTSIRQDAEGRYCLNDLHQAAGGESKHRPNYWLSSAQTRELIGEIEIAGIPAIQSRQGLGTFVAKELVYAYAMWISAAFHLKVIRAYDSSMASAPADPIQQVLNDPAAMRGLLLSYTERVIALESTVAEQAPKVAALDRIATADGSMCITNAAKTLGMRPKDLFQWMQAHRWIYRRTSSSWIAYQDRLQAGWLEHKIATVERADGSEKVASQVLVTAKGLSVLARHTLSDLFACGAEGPQS